MSLNVIMNSDITLSEYKSFEFQHVISSLTYSIAEMVLDRNDNLVVKMKDNRHGCLEIHSKDDEYYCVFIDVAWAISWNVQRLRIFKCGESWSLIFGLNLSFDIIYDILTDYDHHYKWKEYYKLI